MDENIAVWCPVAGCPSELVIFDQNYICKWAFQTLGGVRFHLKEHHRWEPRLIEGWVIQKFGSPC